MTVQTRFTSTLLKETTATVGTGDYTTSGVAATGCQTFDSQLASGWIVPIMVTDGTDYEYGMYTYTSPNVFTRSNIIYSSNTGGPVNWGAGAKSIFSAPLGEMNMLGVQFHKFDAGSAPTTTNDENSTPPYGPGSFWSDYTNQKLYFCIDSTPSAAIWAQILTSLVKIVQPSTMTAAGTTGAQTINKPSGRVNFAASVTSLVVTNSLVTTSSIVIAQVMTNDSTMKSCQVVTASGSFTLYANAAATAETKVAFLVIN